MGVQLSRGKLVFVVIIFFFTFALWNVGGAGAGGALWRGVSARHNYLLV